MDEEQKPEGQTPPEAAQPKGESPAQPVEGATGEAAPSSEAKPAETAATPPAPEKPAAKPAPKAAVKKTESGEGSPADSAEKKHPPKKEADVMAVEPWEGPLVDALKSRFGGEIKEFSTFCGQNFLVADSPSVVPILEYLKLEEDFDYLVDITAVDYPKKEKRFEVVWILYSFAKNVRIRMKTAVAEGEKPRTAVGVHKTADWLEREVFDMFGVEFEGHPNMTRILLPDEWQGYPLRKDYSIIQQDQDWVRENLQIESGQ